MTKAKLLSVKRIWDQAIHNGLTDLIFFEGKFLCAFREADEHAGGADGQIRILSSSDGKEWVSVSLISSRGVDLRDPMLSVMPDGRLMLTMGGSIYIKGKFKGCYPSVTFSQNGVDWEAVKKIDLPLEWIWRVSWYQGVGYGISYGKKLKLYKTTNGLDYSLVAHLNVGKSPSEATIRFMNDGTMVALLRRDGPGWIGHAAPPYTHWKWHETLYRVGGPNFLVLEDQKMWAGSRYHHYIRRKRTPFTGLYRMDLTSLELELVLPSGGDTSYPGMVYHNGLLYMSYYSSHEEKSMIYFATIDLGD